MDRYMNDTHSLYYNVDHSSMYGSNLSTVFADGPPPLEDEGESDHGEFVFSSETNAIGEAVLSKIEGKLQREADEGNENKKSNFDFEPNSSKEKFEAFATSNQVNENANIDEAQEVNGFRGSATISAPSDDSFDEDDFGDFSSGFAKNDEYENGTQKDSFGDFLAVSNKSKLNDNSVFSGVGENLFPKDTIANGNDSDGLEFGDFANFESEGNSSSVDTNSNFDHAIVQHKFDSNKGSIHDSALDDKFASFTDATEDTFSSFVTNKPSNDDGTSKTCSPDVIPANKGHELASTKLPHSLTNHETANDDKFNDFTRSSDGFGKFSQSFQSTENEAKSEIQRSDNDNGIPKIDDSFNNFTGSDRFGDDFSSTECETKSESQSSNHGASKPDDNFSDFTSSDNFGSFLQGSSDTENETKTQKVDTARVGNSLKSTTKNEEENFASSAEDDFGDFADFSNNSFSTFSSDSGIASQKNSDATFTHQSEPSSSQWGDSNFGGFQDNSRTNMLEETNNAMSRNNSKDSDDVPPFSESTSSKKRLEFQADYDVFSQKSFMQTFSTNQATIQSKLVSLHTCFQDVFVTLQLKVEDLQCVKVPSQRRMNQELILKNLHSNMGEGALRFNWEQCKVADKMCQALDVSKKNIVVNTNVLTMVEGLEVPVFATGLGILQPSIAPSPTKTTKRRSKSKQLKEEVTVSISPNSSTPPSPGLSFSEFKTENAKDNNSDTASLSNSDTASLDLDFFASTPVTNLPSNSDSSNSLYNLDFAFGSAPPVNQTSLANKDVDVFKTAKTIQDNPMEILKKLDTSKMSLISESRAHLSPRAMEVIETFDDLSFMHSSVLMFPLSKNN